MDHRREGSAHVSLTYFEGLLIQAGNMQDMVALRFRLIVCSPTRAALKPQVNMSYSHPEIHSMGWP